MRVKLCVYDWTVKRYEAALVLPRTHTGPTGTTTNLCLPADWPSTAYGLVPAELRDQETLKQRTNYCIMYGYTVQVPQVQV